MFEQSLSYQFDQLEEKLRSENDEYNIFHKIARL